MVIQDPLTGTSMTYILVEGVKKNLGQWTKFPSCSLNTARYIKYVCGRFSALWLKMSLFYNSVKE